jgi:predicted phage tail protein
MEGSSDGTLSEDTRVIGDARLKAMRWNERIRLVIGVFNRSAVAVLGAAAVGSALQSPGAGPAAVEAGIAGMPLTSLGCALLLHLLAHALVGLIEPED